VSPCTKLILYLTATYPNVDTFLTMLETCSSVVDMFEIGVPTENPKYDGPTVRMTHREAQIRGVDALKVVKGRISKDFVVMAYFEDYLNNLDKFFETSSEIGAKSILFPDLLFDYYDMVNLYYRKCLDYGLKPCFFISSKFPYREVERLLKYEPYFIYLGLQACSGIRLPIFIERNVKIYKSIIDNNCPLIVGFAIRRPEDVELLIKLNVDGIVIGSAFIKEFITCGLECGLKLLESLRKVIMGC